MATDRKKPDLGKSLAVDVVSALCAGIGCSPFVTIIDRAIFENASGTKTLLDSVKGGFREVFTKPHIFLRRPEVLMIMGVYVLTYTAANTIDTMCVQRDRNPEIPKFLGTSVVNVALSLSKDRAYTQMFGHRGD
jgi:hypothetical protein